MLFMIKAQPPGEVSDPSSVAMQTAGNRLTLENCQQTPLLPAILHCYSSLSPAGSHWSLAMAPTPKLLSATEKMPLAELLASAPSSEFDSHTYFLFGNYACWAGPSSENVAVAGALSLQPPCNSIKAIRLTPGSVLADTRSPTIAQPCFQMQHPLLSQPLTPTPAARNSQISAGL